MQRQWMKLRLQPIWVYCMHHVSASYDAESMDIEDWMQIDEFKNKVQSMRREGVVFISLTDAYNKMKNDKFRIRKFGVLTFDDGYASLKEILPWLEEQQIPATLFVNGKYLDGKSYRRNPKEQYLTKDELFALTSPLIEIGSHGWEHVNAMYMSNQELIDSINNTKDILSSHPRFVPFHAYAYGKRKLEMDQVLRNIGMTPVIHRCHVNYNNPDLVDRMPLM